MKNLFLFLALMLCSFKVSAQTSLVSYGFDNSTLAPTSFNSTLVSASNVSIVGATLVGFGNGVNGNPDKAPYTKNWPTGMAYSPTKYFEIILTASIGKTIQINNIKVWERYRPNGPGRFSIRSSADGYSSSIVEIYGYSLDDWQYVNTNTSSILISNGGSVTFRFYGGYADNSLGLLAIDSLTVDGTDITTLPIELLSFDAFQEKENVKVNWSTASEQDNDHFIVERSEDGKDYQTVAVVTGAGNSQQVLDYSIVDKSVTSGWYYYRLTQVDYDGQSEVFDGHVVPVNVVMVDKPIYPNPASVGQTVFVPPKAVVRNTLGKVIQRDLEVFVPKSAGIYMVSRQELVVE